MFEFIEGVLLGAGAIAAVVVAWTVVCGLMALVGIIFFTISEWVNADQAR